ncbi:hypothetical protein E6O75_ATG04883 [Venturia nashicola]|uniref:Uncharacterized protein n=1 Tax=Venturia nashicola TaxID=86259 RepID=A0A4Z1NYY3_9PEZI|nr:hypothetical protein E6O75_ATG04883 [Venturia nashicola]
MATTGRKRRGRPRRPWFKKEGGIPVTETYGQKFTMSYFELEDTQSKQFYQVLEHGNQSTELKASAYGAQPVQKNGYVPVAGTSCYDGQAQGTLYRDGWQRSPQQPSYAY